MPTSLPCLQYKRCSKVKGGHGKEQGKVARRRSKIEEGQMQGCIRPVLGSRIVKGEEDVEDILGADD